jgi:hypothetical protein
MQLHRLGHAFGEITGHALMKWRSRFGEMTGHDAVKYPWLAVYHGKKRVTSSFCDKGTQSDYNFEFKRTKQGQLNGDALLSIKKGKTRFDDLPNGPIPD